MEWEEAQSSGLHRKLMCYYLSLMAKGEPKSLVKTPVNLGKTEDRHRWNAGTFFWAECLCRPGKSDIDIFMSSVMAFGVGALGCNEVRG